MKFFRVHPSRPFNLWAFSAVDAQRRITRPVFAYDFATAEPIFMDTRYAFVTRSCGAKLAAMGLTGFRLEDVETRRSRDAEAADLALAQEPVAWLHVEGEAGHDDFGIQHVVNLIVSERALRILESLGMNQAEIFDYDPAYTTPTIAQLLARQPGPKNA